MKKKINYWKILTYFVYAIVIVFAFLAISAKLSIGGVKLLVVKSGSMEPTIKTGSLVIDKSKDNYQIGDVVTYKGRENSQETTTHRIVDLEYQGNIILYTTQGDANGSPDSEKVTQDRIMGKVMIAVPYFGYVVAFTRTLPGLIILIVIPATIIIYDEVNNIKKEIVLRRKRREEDNEKSS